MAGRIVEASNATLLATVRRGERSAACVYKPVAGERPLWDFPDGTLAAREVAAYEVSAAAGFDVVPPTVLRDGPLGPGSVQLWVDHPADRAPGAGLVDVVAPGDVRAGWIPVLQAYDADGDPVVLVHADDPRLAVVAVFDAVVNNADRKAGHVLVDDAGRVRGVDHGLTFHVEDKLRTVLWGWAGRPLPDDARARLEGLRTALADGTLAGRLAALLDRDELVALTRRTADLLDTGTLPRPGAGRPLIPWPPLLTPR